MPNKVGTIYNTRFGRLTNDELLSKLKEAYKLLGHPISKNDLRKLKDFGYPSLYENRFGSWSKAIILANIPPVTKKDARRRSAKTRVIKYNPKKLFPCLTLRFKVLNRDNFTCQYCGRTPQYGTVLVIDHITPKSKGGETILNNLITSCFECNSGKYDILLNKNHFRKKKGS